MSELEDPWRFPGQRQARANFSQTCSLLSQYLKEKGSFDDLNQLGISSNSDGNGMPTATATGGTVNFFPVSKSSRNECRMSQNLVSMDLFPQQSGFGSNVSKVEEEIPKKVDSSLNKSQPEPETAQMTIFYAGQVIVFNDLPPDKAKEVLLFASKGSSHNNPSRFPSTPVPMPIKPTNSAPNYRANIVHELIQQLPQSIANEIPIARKASLTRFLKKRKDRITARAPYHLGNSTASPPPKLAESKSWLGLAGSISSVV